MILNYIILFSLGTILMGMSFSLQNIYPWTSDLLSNLATGFYCSIVLYYIIERAQDKMQKERELPLKRALLFNMARHFNVIIIILQGVPLQQFKYYIKDDEEGLIKELNSLKEVKPIIGNLSFPSEFIEKFFTMMDHMDAGRYHLSIMPEKIKNEYELSLANYIKQLYEMIDKLEFDHKISHLSDFVENAQDAIDIIKSRTLS